MEARTLGLCQINRAWGMSQSVTRLLLGVVGSGWDRFSLGVLAARHPSTWAGRHGTGRPSKKPMHGFVIFSDYIHEGGGRGYTWSSYT